VQLAVLDRDLAAPPASPAEGQRWLVAASPGGDWAGHAHEVAAWQDGGWSFYPPRVGWLTYVADEGALLAWTGSAWIDAVGALSSLNNMTLLGVGTTADATNPFSAKLNNALWTARYGGEGGDGDLRYKLNKEAPGRTLSVLMQSNWSGRAEIGLVGNDDLSFKVSADGDAWKEALVLDRVTGAARFPSGIVHPDSGLTAPLYIPSPTAELWRFDVSRQDTPRTVTMSGASGTTITLASPVAGPNGQWGRWQNMAGASYLRVWNMSKTPHQSAWIADSPTSTTLSVTDAAHIAGWANGDTIRLGDPNPTGDNALEMVAMDISPYLQSRLGAVFPQKGLMLGLYVSSSNGPSGLDFSGTGAGGSAVGGNALSDGSRNQSSLAVTTNVPSPISDSNLLFVRETLFGGSTDLTVALARVLGVYV
jgi:hypothetical protein